MKDIVLDRIGKSAPTQKKKIEKFFAEYPNAEIELTKFLDMYKPYMEKESISIDIVVDSYLDLINQVLYARLEFLRTGCYPAKSQEVALDEVYKNKGTMQQYMLGLALSYFLWRHHFQLLTFYRESLKYVASGKRFMEVGCGHGLLLVELLNRTLIRNNVDVVDISQHSINMTKKLLETILPHIVGEVKFFHCDVFDFESNHKYDFITVGEVLEHVDKPLELLAKLANLLAPEGHIFVTTCANCPAIDHVYHFKNVQEIKDVINGASLVIEREIIAPSERKSMDDLEKYKIDISYAATLIKKISE